MLNLNTATHTVDLCVCGLGLVSLYFVISSYDLLFVDGVYPLKCCNVNSGCLSGGAVWDAYPALL